jgi:D-2-hydroxyacid dehydrogenase (NADP+)
LKDTVVMTALERIVITFDLDDKHLDRLRREFPDIDFVLCLDQGRLPEVLPVAQALVGGGIRPDLLETCPDLRWVHSQGTGVDGLLFSELVESDVVVTNNSGVQASNMAEHLLAMMLAFARGLPELVRHQSKGKWIQPLRTQVKDQSDFYEHPTFEIGYQTLGIAGLGSVGRALAVRARALGMHVIGFRRRQGDPPEGIDRIYGPDDWHEMLAEADHIANCLPLTPRTRHLFGEREFQSMKPTAYFYNVGRGETVDQDALTRALQSSGIAGAGLDVTTPEPLPADSPLWYTPNVLITSHTSGLSPNRWDRGIEILIENIRRYRQGQPLVNIVDKREGY